MGSKLTKLRLNNHLIQIRHESSSTKNIIEPVNISAPDEAGESIRLISDSPITQGLEELLINFHDTFNLEWSSTVILTAFVFRACVAFPFRIYQERLQAKLINLQPVIKELTDKKLKHLTGDLPNKNDMHIRFEPKVLKNMAKEVLIENRKKLSLKSCSF